MHGEGFVIRLLVTADQASERDVVVAARPEELVLHRLATDGALRCRVVSELPMGYTSLVQVSAAGASGERFVTIEHPRSDALFEPGTDVWVSLAASSVHVFDAITSHRVASDAA